MRRAFVGRHVAGQRLRRRIGHFVIVWSSAVFALVVPTPALPADPLDSVPLETRAALAVAACSYSFSEAPVLNPADPRFRPDAVSKYLRTYRPKEQYGAQFIQQGVPVSVTILQSPDDAKATQLFAEWRGQAAARQGPAEAAGWPETGMPVFMRQTLAPAGSGRASEMVARGQAGVWQFEVSASSKLDPGKEKEAVHATLAKLADSARRFGLFPQQMLVEFSAGPGRPLIRLAPGEPFRVPLNGTNSTPLVLRVSLLDGQGKPLDAEHVHYRVRLGGALAPFAQTNQDGELSAKAEQEFDLSGEETKNPVLAKWVLPPLSNAAFRAQLQSRHASSDDFSVQVEATFRAKAAPAVSPPV